MKLFKLWVPLVAVLLGACQKETPEMELVAEGYGGTKAAVNGIYSYWVDGELVRINGTPYTINADANTAYVSGVPVSPIFRALYPDSLNSSAALDDDNVRVRIPRIYTYRESNGLQQLGVPMAARGTGADRLEFKHLTAALTVEVKNVYGFTIGVDSIVVISNNYQLCGERDITLANDITVNAVSSNVPADKQVKISFDGGVHLQIPSGETRRVQVPVLPVGDDNRFTIQVGVHKVDDADVKQVFSREQGGTQEHYALARRQMGYAGVTFGSPFSVAVGKQVIIAQGNLMYVPKKNKWSFHSHPYDLCETGPVDSTSRYHAESNDPIDLFGFGTSDSNNMHPYMTSKTSTDYVAPSSNISKTGYDWGWYNAISNGGNVKHRWYTLPYGQWQYIFDTRNTTTSGINGNATTRYTYATIGDTYKGLIIFPDVYTHPTDVTVPVGAVFNGASAFTFTVTAADWAKMEAAGAVFLPAAGYRYNKKSKSVGCHYINVNTGMYWSSSSESSIKAYRVRFISNTDIQTIEDYREFGMSVRVVRDL